MAIGDRYQLIDRQSYFGELALNVYYYKQTDGTGGAEELATAWISDVGSAVRAVQIDALSHTRVDVVNLDDPTDYTELAWTANNTGLRGGSGNPTFIAWGFRLNRVSRLARHGQKRIAGVSEGDVVGNAAESAVMTALNACAAALEADVTDSGANGTWQPVIMKKTGNPPNVVYTDYPVGGAQFVRVTSQVSRRAGRGA